MYDYTYNTIHISQTTTQKNQATLDYMYNLLGRQCDMEVSFF